MPLNLQLQALVLPSGTQFPGTPQALLNQNAAYTAIVGGESFSGVNYGPVEPAPADRDKPWFKTEESGFPIGWFAWDGSMWDAIPLIVPSGGTTSRPANASLGQLYLDTDINVTLRWTGTAWITDAGSPGDVKEVKAASLTDALAKNPGWAYDSDSDGLFIIGASDGTSDPQYGAQVGASEYALLITDLPNDTISLLSGWGIFPGQFQNGAQAPGVQPICTGLGSVNTKTTGPINPNTQTKIPLTPPAIAYFRLYKVS